MSYYIELRDGSLLEFDDKIPFEKADALAQKDFPSLTSKPLGERLTSALKFGTAAAEQSHVTQEQQKAATGGMTFTEGFQQLAQPPDVPGLLTGKLSRKAPTAEELRSGQARTQATMQAYQPSNVMLQLDKAFEEKRAGEYLWEHGPELALEAWAVSLPQSVPALGAQAAATAVPGGPVFKRALQTATAGGSSAWIEYNAEMNQWLREKGYDLSAPGVAEKVFNDQKLVAEMQTHSAIAAKNVGLFDALGYALGTKVLAPSKLSPLKKELTNVALQGGIVQPATGAGGEAMKQVELYGSVTKPSEVVLEALGEVATGPVDVAMAGLSGARADATTGLPDVIRRQAWAAAFSTALDKAVVESGDPAVVVDSGKTLSWEESAAKVREQLGQPGKFWSDAPPQFFEDTDVVEVQATTPQEVQAEVRQRLEEVPSVADKYVLRNIDKIAGAHVNIPNELARLVDNGGLNVDTAAGMLTHIEHTLGNAVRAAEETATRVQERYNKESEQYLKTLPALELPEGYTNAVQAVDAALQNALPIIQAPSTIKRTKKGQQAFVTSELEKAGLSPEIAQTIASLPTAEQKPALARVQKFLSRIPTWGDAEMHTGIMQYSALDNTIDSVQGKTITFGPQRGKGASIGVGEPGAVNVVNDDPQFDVALERRLAAILRKWTKKFLPGVDVILYIDPSTEKFSLGSMRLASGSDGRMTLKIELRVRKFATQAEMMTTLAHEFGHGMFIKYYITASKAMQAALRQHWINDVLVNWDMPLAQYLRRYGPIVSRVISTKKLGDILTTAEILQGSAQYESDVSYWPNFWEWHATNMHRMLLNDYEGMTTTVRTFWRTAFNQLAKFFGVARSEWHEGQTLAEWLRISREYEVGQLLANAGLAQATQRAQNIGVDAFEKMNSGIISSANNPQISTPTTAPAAATINQQDDPFVQNIKTLQKRLGKHPHGTQVANAIVKFNEGLAYFLGTFQVLKKNISVPGAMRFLDALRAKMGYKNVWLREANQIASEWEGLHKTQAGALAKLLMTEAMDGSYYSDILDDPARPGRKIFVLDPDKAAEFGVNEAGAAVYSKIRSVYMAALDAMEQLGKERLARQFADDPSNPQMQSQLDELVASYTRMREKPYTPFSRFGKYFIRIKAKDSGRIKDPITGSVKLVSAGETVYFETFETEVERNAALPKVQTIYHVDPLFTPQFDTGKIHDIVYSMRNLPPQFVESIANRLELSKEQMREYNELLKDLAADASFIKHMKRKSNVAGYSADALRGFADYFMRFANNYAKHRSAPEFDAALADVRAFKNDEVAREQAKGAVPNTTRLDEFYNWLVRTRDYVMNPGNELGELKSFVAAWYLGFNIMSAVQNITQVPMVTLPFLTKRYGTVKALGALKQATIDIAKSLRDPSVLDQSEQAMFAYSLESGFIDESLATSVAQFAEGTALSRISSTALRHRLLNWYNHKAMYVFQKIEEFNRRVTMLATYRLATSPRDDAPGFDHNAFMKARDAVEVTQNEYALENRPEFMRGNKSIVFQFMHFQQNQIYNMFGGDPSYKRMLLMQLAVAGLLGAPFADDLLDLYKLFAKMFGVHAEPEMELRQLLKELDIQPDIVLRGASSMIGEFDASYRFSLGKVVPGLEALASNKTFADAVVDAVGDVGGAGAAAVMGAFKAASNINNPDRLKTASYVAPAFMRYIFNAIRAAEEGGITTRDKALIAPLDTGEILGLAAGLQPRTVTKAWTAVGFQRESEAYWTTRRGALLYNWYVAVESRDREAIADVRKRIRLFNREVRKVDPKGLISASTLRKSLKQRMKAKLKHEVYGTPTAYRNIARESLAAVEE